jgi:hypothetical protein
MNYMQARWYSNATGTFVSVDPVIADAKDPQAYNAYAYVRNNPMSHVDPTGEYWEGAGRYGGGNPNGGTHTTIGGAQNPGPSTHAVFSGFVSLGTQAAALTVVSAAASSSPGSGGGSSAPPSASAPSGSTQPSASGSVESEGDAGSRGVHAGDPRGIDVSADYRTPSDHAEGNDSELSRLGGEIVDALSHGDILHATHLGKAAFGFFVPLLFGLSLVTLGVVLAPSYPFTGIFLIAIGGSQAYLGAGVAQSASTRGGR